MQGLLQVYLAEEKGCAPGQFSWAWIEPDGTFHKVVDHARWALDYFGAMIIQYPEMDRNFKKLVTPQGWRDVDSEGKAVSISIESLEKLKKLLVNTPFYEQKHTVLDSWSDKEELAWEHMVNLYHRYGPEMAKEYALVQGWMRAANPFTVAVMEKGTRPQWRSFFENGIRCWSGSFDRKLYADIEDHVSQVPYTDAIYQHLPKKEADRMMEEILKKS